MHVRERKMCFFLPWAHSYPGKPEESDSPGTVDTGTWEPSDMGAGNQAQVILQSLAQCSQHCGLENLACGLGEVLRVSTTRGLRVTDMDLVHEILEKRNVRTIV